MTAWARAACILVPCSSWNLLIHSRGPGDLVCKLLGLMPFGTKTSYKGLGLRLTAFWILVIPDDHIQVAPLAGIAIPADTAKDIHRESVLAALI